MLKLLNFKKNIAKIIVNILIINFFTMTSEAISKPVNLPAGSDPQNTIVIELKDGNVLIELLLKETFTIDLKNKSI